MFGLLVAVAVYGSGRVEINRDLAQSWVGESERLARLRDLDRKLQGADGDLILLVGADRMWTREGLIALQELHLELELADGVASVVSAFSLHRGDITKEAGQFVIPQDLGADLDIEAVRQRVARHPFGGGYLVSHTSAPEQWLVYLVNLDSVDRSEDEEALVVHGIEAIAATYANRLGGSFITSGLPKVKIEIVDAVANEFFFYSIVGLIVGISIAAAYFRSLRFTVITSACPAFAAILAFGCLGITGVKVSPLLDAVPSLVMAVAFTDTMHLMSGVRRRLLAGESVREALETTFELVAPACSVASITTAVAMVSLIVADAKIIREFGIVAAAGTMLGVASLMVSVPLLSRLLLRRQKQTAHPTRRLQDGILRRISAAIAGPVVANGKAVTVAGCIATAAVVAIYFQLDPRFRLGDQLPLASSSRAANDVMDRHFDGSNPVFVALDASGGTVTPEELLATTREARKALEGLLPNKTIVSIDALRDEIGPGAQPSDEAFDKWLLENEDIADSRLFSASHRISALAFLIPNASSSEVVALVDKVSGVLEPLAKNIELVITGLPVILATEVPAMVVEMNWALFGAFLCVFVLLGYLFRSARIILLAIAPNLLPVFSAGLVIAMLEGGLSLACIVGMTVGFGLAVDNSSHFLNRLLIESRSSDGNALISGTLIHIGPILIATTAVLAFCLMVTSIGQGPNGKTFSYTCVVVLIFALVSNLIVLPAILSAFGRRKPA